MPRHVLAFVWLSVAAAASCSEEEPRFGPPGSIRDRGFGTESTPGSEGGTPPSSLFPRPYDPTDPPPVTEPLASRHPYAALSDRMECLGCHSSAGTAQNKWAFGGRVNAKTTGTTAEIVVTRDDRTLVGHVKAAPDGYFWAALDGGGVSPSNTRTAVRTSVDTAEMATAAAGGCNASGTCHGGTTGPIVVPK
jgi:hypothetical protein